MSKLSSLKEWVLLDEAAQHLSIAFGEKVTKADVLRLALDGRLTLSLNIVNSVPAKSGRFVPMPEIREPATFLSGEKIGGTEVPGPVVFEPWNETDVVNIRGVFDLKMVGGNLWTVLLHHQHMTQGPLPSAKDDDGRWRIGAVLEADDGQLFQIQREFVLGFFGKVYGLLRTGRWLDLKPSFWSSSVLPLEDSRLVVRTEVLRALEQPKNVTSMSVDKPLATTERTTLLTIIAALCDYSAISHQERGAASQIAKLTEEIGAPVTDDTIRKVLAKIPDALENRMK